MTERTYTIFSIENIDEFKIKLLAWSQEYKKVIWLDSNNNKNLNSNPIQSDFDAVLAVDSFSEISSNHTNSFSKLKEFQKKTKDYIFGYLGYDLKNDIEKLNSNNFDGLKFPDVFFFQPKKMFFIKGAILEVRYLLQFESEIESAFSIRVRNNNSLFTSSSRFSDFFN